MSAEAKKIIDAALERGRETLSEYESAALLAAYGIPTAKSELAATAEEAKAAAERMGTPVAAKGCGASIAHKTEKGLVALNLKSPEEVEKAFNRIAAGAGDGLEGVLIQEMVEGKRELVAGLTRDPTFGPCVLFGLGGIMAEALKDVSLRIAPLEKRDVLQMADKIRGKEILGPFRGMKPVDADELARILIALGRIGLELEGVREIDINPLIVANGKPIAADALVVLNAKS